MNSLLRLKLANALTDYDRKQSTKKHYNHYALGLYLQALNRCEQLAKQHDLRLCLLNCFNGRLLDYLLRVSNLPTSTKAEQFGDFISLGE